MLCSRLWARGSKMTDDPDFFAWLDGELAEPQASAMAARVAADPELSAFAEEHRALGSRLREAFAPVVAGPLPDRLRAAVAQPSASVIDFTATRERRARRWNERWSVQGLALAASLALGLTIGAVLPRNDGGSFRSDDGRLLAAGTLQGALSTQLASAGNTRGVRIGLSFRNADGRYCRSFEAEVQSGLACRAGDGWAIEGLVSSTASQSDYRMAAGSDPALAALIDQRLAGDPLDEAAERRARDRGWR